MGRFLRYLCLSLACLACILHANESVKKTIQNAVIDVMGEHDVKGLSLSVFRSNSVIFESGFGYRDVGNRYEISANTSFSLFTLSKVFTSMAVLELEQMGQLNLDASITQYLTDLSPKARYRSIRVRDLLTHYSGLSRDYWPCIFNNPTGCSYEEVRRYLSKEPLVFKPGQTFAYSNIAYVLLGELVSRVTKTDFEAYMQEFIRDRLNLSNTGYFLSADSSPAYKRYNLRDDLDCKAAFLPVCGLSSSVSDLRQFAQALLGSNSTSFMGRSLKPRSEKDRFLNLSIAYPWMIRSQLGPYLLNSYFFDGGSLSFQSVIQFFPDIDLGIVVLANSESERYVNGLIDEIVLALIDAGLLKKPALAIERKLDSMPPKSLSAYDGAYATYFGLLDFKKKGKHYISKFKSNSVRFEKNNDGIFTMKGLLFGFIPVSTSELKKLNFYVAEKSGRDLLMLRYNQRQTFVFGEKILFSR